MKRFGLYLFLVFAVIGGCAYVYFMLTGPHMKDQPHILAYQYQMPLPPKGIVPVEPDENALPSPDQLMRLRSPLPDTPGNRSRGKTYYDYYCVFCHGDTGQGNGPVGNGYMPKPADLHSPGILQMSDGELLKAMLTGPGHDPVLTRIVPVRHRWYLVLYTRVIGSERFQSEEANKPHRSDFRDRGLR